MNVNRIIVTGNLTRDPELRELPSGGSVCKLRIAVNNRVKRDGEWVDKPNFFNLTAWGAQGKAAAEHLATGSPVAVDGCLEWREWEMSDGAKRQEVGIVAETIQFLGGSQVSAEQANEQSPDDEGWKTPDDEIPF